MCKHRADAFERPSLLCQHSVSKVERPTRVGEVGTSGVNIMSLIEFSQPTSICVLAGHRDDDLGQTEKGDFDALS